MKSEYRRFVVLTSILILITWMISCSGRTGNNSGTTTSVKTGVNNINQAGSVTMDSPGSDAGYKLREEIKVSISIQPSSLPVDSVRIFFDGKNTGLIKSAPWRFTLSSSANLHTGRKSVKAVVYSRNTVFTATHFVVVHSDIAPIMYHYKVIQSYPHDKDAFTQGLFYDDGVLYEGTGQEAGSSLRQVELTTGRVIKQTSLDPSLFGEGITLYKDRIYQVTWKNKVGFVYDKKTFRLINKIYYQTQGWGLTTIDDKIVMSDGTNILYYFDPETFTVISQLEVYDNKKKVDQLNELEYINGEIWANIWMTDLIARIDPVTGRVNSYIDFSTLYPESERQKSDADVLNGIAWDPVNKRIFVTGKRWPELYEIKVTQ